MKSAQYLPCLVQPVVFVLNFLYYVQRELPQALRHRHVIKYFGLLQYLLKVLDDLRNKGHQRLFKYLRRLSKHFYHFFSSVLFTRDQLGGATGATLHRYGTTLPGKRGQERVHSVRIDDVLSHELIELLFGLRYREWISQLAKSHVEVMLKMSNRFN